MVQHRESPSRLELFVRARGGTEQVSPKAPQAQDQIADLNKRLRAARQREHTRRAELIDARQRLIALQASLRESKLEATRHRDEVMFLKQQLGDERLATTDDDDVGAATTRQVESAAVVSELARSRAELQEAELRLTRLRSSMLGRMQLRIWRMRRRATS